MSSKPDHRPMSPYMLGPYYKFQITSLLSITSRVTGVLLTLLAAPLAITWMVALMLGPDAYQAVHGFLGTILGKLILFVCNFSLCYHLVNGLRHLMWDTGRGLSMERIRSTGYLAVVVAVALTLGVWWAGS